VAGATFAHAYGLLAELDYAYVRMDQLIGGVWPHYTRCDIGVLLHNA
jgi:hypothetical protein